MPFQHLDFLGRNLNGARFTRILQNTNAALAIDPVKDISSLAGRTGWPGKNCFPPEVPQCDPNSGCVISQCPATKLNMGIISIGFAVNNLRRIYKNITRTGIQLYSGMACILQAFQSASEDPVSEPSCPGSETFNGTVQFFLMNRF